MKTWMSLVFLVNFLPVEGRVQPGEKKSIDVRHYTFQLEVNDSTDVIVGKAAVVIAFTDNATDFELDLADSKGGAGGMEVTDVRYGQTALSYTHEHDKLKIHLSLPAHAGEERKFQISYRGIPRDGLTIGKNKFGDRGFFGDNWPDRGHHWLPVVDHPNDKASVDFIVIAPSKYAVIANGIKVEESPLDATRTLTHWHEEVAIPVKVMVVGIARFAVQLVGEVDHIPVETWVYPQNREEGFSDYAVALRVLDFFHHHIGPYPYRKLANVQSKTRWGGLENANTIFYAENAFNGKGEQEMTIAHEEAHQWFGNSATEKDWHHVWLSEGFATYFANLYLEYVYGHDRLVEEQQRDRDQVIAYFNEVRSPVIDTTNADINSLLNVNTYQKAGWVLHMLRREIGDAAFWSGIRQYYATYQNRNALTDDFRRIMEEVSGKRLTGFFDQWLWKTGHPRLSGHWVYDAKNKSVTITLDQTQPGVSFHFPLDIAIRSAHNTHITTVEVAAKNQKFIIPVTEKPLELTLDPLTWLLFEGEIKP